MYIESIRVKNYRSIREEVLDCSGLTAMVGPNGSGKSAFLNAISLFYSTTDRISLTDFYNDDPTEDIAIRVTFSDLSDEAKELFSKRVEGDRLTAEKVVSWNDGSPSASYHGATLQHPVIARIREAVKLRDRGETAKGLLAELRKSGEYDDLPEWTTIDVTMENLDLWEEHHSDQCKRIRDDGQFFGFRQVGQGYLGRFTRCLFIPAVRDASEDAIEGRGSVFSNLIDLVVRSSLAKKKEVVELRERFQEEYEAIIDPESLPELGNLANELTSTLQTFIPNSEVMLKWLPLDQIEVPTPRADMKIAEDGYAAPLENCGHGLQRAFILTMLQHLAMASYSRDRAEEVDEEGEALAQDEPAKILPNLVLLVEEPELYQHPSRQRHFARILSDLAQSGTIGVADRTQVLYSTHSPHFVGLDRISCIRLFKKIEVPDDLPKQTRVVQVDLNEIAEEIWEAAGNPGEKFTAETLAPRLTTIMTPWMSEGFFADVAVLVEGEDDRAALLGVAMDMEVDLDSKGIAVIPCGGKTNIDRPTAIFRSLGIPVYAVWDSDYGKDDANPATNQLLSRLFAGPDEEWPHGVHKHYACFYDDLESAMKSELGDRIYASIVEECQAEFAIPKKKHAIKNPHVVAEIIRKASSQGRRPATLESILEAIIALKDC